MEPGPGKQYEAARMKIVQQVEWENAVLPAWQRVVGNPKPNWDVAGMLLLHPNLRWYQGIVEENDLSTIHAIACSSWTPVFGPRRILAEMARQQIDGIPDIRSDGRTDDRKHRSKILDMEREIENGRVFDPLILVSHSLSGPFVVLDGNHRAIALFRRNRLAGSTVYFGVDAELTEDFGHDNKKTFHWYRNAFIWTGESVPVDSCAVR